MGIIWKKEVTFLHKRLIKFALSGLGALSFYQLASSLLKILSTSNLISVQIDGVIEVGIYLGATLLGAAALYLLSPSIIKWAMHFLQRTEGDIQKIPVSDIVFASLGLIISLLIASLINPLFQYIPIRWVQASLSVFMYVLLGYLGVSISTKKREDILQLLSVFKRSSSKDKNAKDDNRIQLKILDTSVIIDGRIADICKTGFVEGSLVIPGFVLEELRHIADSSDSLKRNRGRRGLDILNKIQKELPIKVEIYDKDFDDISEVDSKLLKLAQVLGAKVVTNDYNLNKVAEFQGVSVLNINELANAVKPVVLPGEEMVVTVIKDGKESGQGVAYLDDGTMIVVDSGRKYIGDTIGVLVTSVLQTSAGRMIFAKPKSMVDKAV
jgi:uncharacterized protein YacL